MDETFVVVRLNPFEMKSIKKNISTKTTEKAITKSEIRKKSQISGAQVKKESKKTKTETGKNKTGEKTHNKEQSSSKKRKLDIDSENESNKKIRKTKDSVFNWTDEEYLAEHGNVSVTTAKKVIDLFNKDNTIPFIARYRRELTGGLTADQLRKIKSTYDYIQTLHVKAEKLVRQVSSNESVPSELLTIIQVAHTHEELDFVASHFNKDKRTLAARAKELGLEPVALKILEEKDSVKLENLVNPTVPGLESINKVKSGIQHIIADTLSKNPEVHSHLDIIYSSKEVLLQSKFKKNSNKDLSKYHVYGDFSQSVNTIKPHQTLAINRGESEDVLSVKVVIPDFLWQPLKTFCHKKWLKSGSNELRRVLFTSSVDDAIKRLLEPLAIRKIRSKLKKEAEEEAINVFGTNLQQLLMTPPCSGNVVMGIDPGFKNGCKVAVVSHTGEPIGFDRFFLNDKTEARRKLKKLVLDHTCCTIALGNGTACRETESLLSEFITRGVFKPFNVCYTIVNEQGVSIYSCSEIATKEFPKVDPYIVGAISIARRLQNPLSELVKVEPKHLGVGMYQHDVQEKKLVATLDEIVSECVSFVGVDINTASFSLLKRVAGLTASKAEEIIKHRTEVCSFKSREDLKLVKGIKTATFLQCAGFIRIVPSTAKCLKHKSCKNHFNPLDETCIHPESYESTYKILNHFGLELKDLGSEKFVSAVEEKKKSIQAEELARICNCSNVIVNFIIDTLMKPKNFDLRGALPGPIFRNEITTLESLSPGQILEGVIRNVVNFGAFVDVGVGADGLIHNSKMKNQSVQLNDRVKVKVLSINAHLKKVELELVSLL